MSRRRTGKSNLGKRKITCRDCNQSWFVWPSQYGQGRKTAKDRCKYCGSTFLDLSDAEMKERANVKHVRAMIKYARRSRRNLS